METKILKKALKSYLKAKEINDENSENSMKYIYQCLKYINKLREENLDSKYKSILKETEDECHNMLNESLYIQNNESTVNSEEIFKEIEKGNLEFFKNNNFSKKQLNTINDDGDTPLHYCIKQGDVSILKILLTFNTSINCVNKDGHTLLELACLCKDPNCINFLINHGANMEKSLYLRNGEVKLHLKINNLDVACIVKILLLKSYKKEINPKLYILKNYFNFEELCGLGNFKYSNLIIGLGEILDDKIDNYLEIILDELKYPIKNHLGCYENKLEILIYNLVPFIDYKFNITSENIVVKELQYIILKNKYNKKKILDNIWNDYIKLKLVNDNYLGIQLNKIYNNSNIK